MKKCKVENCSDEYKGLGYCSKHYQQYKKYGEVGITESINGQIQCKNSNCSTQFKQKHRRHIFCCDKCKSEHNNHSETHKLSMTKFNRSEKGKERSKKFLKTDKGKIYNKNKSARQRDKNYVKCYARIIASRHLKAKPCSVDGCDNIGEKHHGDYNEPLNVVYLCRKHHMELHYGSDIV